MVNSRALIPLHISSRTLSVAQKVGFEIGSLVGGVALLALLARVVIPLPNTPVPITGQTFGVLLVALSWGQRRSLAVVGSYLVLGWVGLPLFATTVGSLVLGPTSGYLVGMVLAGWAVGGLADRGWTSDLLSALVSSFLGSALILSVGALGLSFFVPSESILALGVYPFLAGDLAKSVVAALMAWRLSQWSRTL